MEDRSMKMLHTLPRLAIATLLAGAACAKGDNGTDTAQPQPGVTDSSAAVRADSVRDSIRTDSTAARGGWTEPSILGYASAANAGEIEEAKLAEKRATNPAVKAFAKELAADHEAMLAEGKSLAGKLNVTADTAGGDAHDLMNDSRDHLKSLNDKAAGADWDEEFIDHAIDMHQKVLDKLQDAAKNSSNAELRTALEKATGKVQQHLTKAQDIKANKLKR
jgi:putative membrane protein